MKRLQLQPAWAAVALLTATAAAFWFTFSATAGNVAETPLGLSPAVIPLALIAGWLAYRRDSGTAPPRDGFLDITSGLLFAGLALWLVWAQPGQTGWAYWAERRDLVAAELFALGAACWLFGIATLWRLRPALLLLAAGSSPALLWLQDHLASPLALLTSDLARPLAVAAGAHFAADPDPTVFNGISTSGEAFRITVGDVCSGLSSWISVLLIGIPAALYFGMERRSLLKWAGAGLALATVANVLRVAVILVTATRFGASFAMGDVHPWLGIVCILVVFLALFLIPGKSPLPAPKWAFAPATTPALVLLTLTSVAGAAGQSQLVPFQALPAQGAAGPDVEQPLQIVPSLPGWTVQATSEISWQNLFGPASRSVLLTHQRPDGPPLTAQLVATPDRNALMAHSPEQCGLYHGEDVQGQRTVDLGNGQVGYLVDSTDRVPVDDAMPAAGTRPLRFDVLYWYVPFTVESQPWTARITLILDSDAEGLLSSKGLEPGLAPGGASFETVDNSLWQTARGMVAATAQQANAV